MNIICFGILIGSLLAMNALNSGQEDIAQRTISISNNTGKPVYINHCFRATRLTTNNHLKLCKESYGVYPKKGTMTIYIADPNYYQFYEHKRVAFIRGEEIYSFQIDDAVAQVIVNPDHCLVQTLHGDYRLSIPSLK